MNQDHEMTSMTNIARMFSVDDYMYFYSEYLNADRSNAEASAVVERLDMNYPMRVLDLACGFGRIANRLALMGHRVIGIEYLSDFLELARAAAEPFGILDASRGGAVHYQQGDMRQIDFINRFERVIMMFNSFGYFSDAENLDLLQRISRALVPGGLLGFDIANRDGVLSNFHPHYVTEKESNLMINRFYFNVITGRLNNDRIIIRNGERKDLPFSIRLYSVSEIQVLLDKVGMELVQVYGEWDGRPLEQDSPTMVVISRKL